MRNFEKITGITHRMSMAISISITLCFSSCVALGTKTLYKQEGNLKVKSIGVMSFEGSAMAREVYSNTTQVYFNTMFERAIHFGLEPKLDSSEFLPLNNPDTSKIVLICKENQLDGLIASRLEFVDAEYNLFGDLVVIGFDTKVTLLLFDKNGKLLIATKHNSKTGNSYWMPPKPDIAIHDAVEGAFNRIAKEIGLSEN